MNITIERKRKYNHIIGEEFERTYSKHEIKMAKNEIDEAIYEFEGFCANNSMQLDDFEIEEIEKVQKLKNGFYDFDCGDFVYYVTIERLKN